ncbi:MAG: alkaline phosphatase family protein [Nocardioides sp.]
MRHGHQSTRRPDRRSELAGRLASDSLDKPWSARIAFLLGWVVATVLAVLFCNAVVPGFHADVPWGPLEFALLLAATGVVLQPLLVAGAVRIGWLGIVVVAVIGQALIVGIAAWILPRVRVDDIWATLLVAWIIGIVGTIVGWLSTAGTNEALVGRMVSRARRHPEVVDDPELPGVLFIQMDGVPYPVLHMSVMAGTLPTLSRWIRGGSHQLRQWTPKLPATTPASQMGILHGVIDGIPAFRWYDRAHDRVVVANKPADAALIEETLTTGRGLLADGGASISNLFTGDAPHSALTMSRGAGASDSTRRAVARFVTTPSGLTRSLSRTVSELLRDRFQSRRAIRRDVQPRCERTWTTALLRSVTNGALRDLNTVLVSQHMLQGTRSVYVDYVDYDEIAHHAGVLRPEALEALESIDGVVRQLELVASVAPRPYVFVLLSDHGQSQGATFADRYDEELAVVVSRLAAADVEVSDSDVEGWGRTRGLVDELSTGRGVGSGAMRSASGAMVKRDRDDPDLVKAAAAPSTRDETFHVFGSGNLGLIYVRGEKRQLTRRELDERFPALVDGLAAHPGVGFAVVRDDEQGPMVLGARGSHRLVDGHIDGVDPLLPFGPDAPGFVLRVALRPEAPDIYVNSLLEEGTNEVAAFEGLVGCHGGLGGWQDHAFVMVPTGLPFPEERVVGADAMHRALVNVLRHLGHRTQIPDDATASAHDAAVSGT